MKKRFITLLMLALAFTTVGGSAAKVFAIDEVFFSGNDILFYDPDDQSCSTTAVADTGNNAGNAFNYFVAKGLNAKQSAAIVGNLMQESRVNPKALNSIGAYGIAQWLGDRKARLYQQAYYQQPEAQRDDTKELQAQLEFMSWEFANTESAAYNKFINATTDDVGELAIIFGEAYERYGSNEEGNRAQYARDILQQYGNTVSSSTACDVIGAGDFVYYSQRDPKWGNEPYGSFGTIAEDGCGPTSLAMIVATFFDKSATPKTLADLGAENGAVSSIGTIHAPLLNAAAEKWKFTWEDVSGQSLDVAINAVKNGDLVYMGGQGVAPFTRGGHVVVMRSITDTGTIVIADPYRNAADVYTREIIEANRGTTIIVRK